VTARYLVTLTDEGAARLEKWLGSKVQLISFTGTTDPLADLRYTEAYCRLHDAPELAGAVPDYHRAEADRRLARLAPVDVQGLDAITDEEYEFIARRLRTGGPLYHAGGPG